MKDFTKQGVRDLNNLGKAISYDRDEARRLDEVASRLCDHSFRCHDFKFDQCEFCELEDDCTHER